MNVREIVLEKIAAVGADGLCNEDCGCSKDDICFYDGIPEDCVLARAVLKKEHCHPENCEQCNISCDAYGEACITDEKMYIPLELKKQFANVLNDIESIADEKFEEFKKSNPIVAETMVQLFIRDPAMFKIVKTIWNKGYTCGFTDAALNLSHMLQ